MSSFDSPMPMAEQPPIQQPITPTMIDALRKTKPWVRFLSILFFVNAGLAFLGGVLVMVSGAALSGRNSPFGGGGEAVAVLVGLFYLIVGGLYITPAIFLFRYADGIQRALVSDLVGGMEHALKSQKSFWVYAGIVAMISLIIVFVAILVFIATASRLF